MLSVGGGQARFNVGDTLKTPIYKYEPLRKDSATGDVTAVDTTLSPTTANYTFHVTDRPSGAFKLNEEYNGSEIIFENYDTSAAINSAAIFWGYGRKGPAEFMGDFSLTTGTARIDDAATDLYTGTITRVNDVSDGHLKKITIRDSGNNRVAKMWFDNVGYEWIYCEVYDLTTGAKIRPMIRPW